MDYRELLKKYMGLIREHEGISYLQYIGNHSDDDVIFSAHDIESLEVIFAEILEDESKYG